jgi:hypothetical protein
MSVGTVPQIEIKNDVKVLNNVNERNIFVFNAIRKDFEISVLVTNV